MIVVTGATGTIGSRLVRELEGRGVDVRAFVRDRAKADSVLDRGAAVTVGDFGDPASIRAAVGGAETVVVVSGNHPRQPEYEANVFDAVVATGGARIVKVSSVGAHAPSPAPFVDWHHRSEQALRRSGLRATVLRCNFFMSNVLASAAAVRETGSLAAPAGRAAIAMVDPRDVAAAAAVVVTESGHDAPAYELTGPETVTYSRVAETLAGVLGRPVSFVDLPASAAREGLVASGLPEWFADGLVSLFGELRQGIAATVTDTVRSLTGRPPHSLSEFIDDHAAAFSSTDAPVPTPR